MRTLLNAIVAIILRVWQLPQYLVGLCFYFRVDRNYMVGWHGFKMYHISGDKDYHCGELNFCKNRKIYQQTEIFKNLGYVRLSRLSGIWYPIFLLNDGDALAKDLQVTESSPREAKLRALKAVKKVLGISVCLWLFVALVAYFLCK